ncbi:MAG: SGNH/GDSL hydrolase family protein [Streptosporangiales bacterium]|nr:SGNH/GDSL hydrolase family protein [Streptosporangiales bacterium]
MTRIVTLGDSITLGMGDRDPGGGWRGWTQLLAGGLTDPELHNLAVIGAQSKHVERDQLPAALELKPDIASVIVGINDTLRAGFSPVRTGQAVARTVAALRASGATVLTMRLPDPARMFGLPDGLARPLTGRMLAVNAELDRVAARYGTLHWNAAGDPATYDRLNWSVDRLHPNERGHRLVARRFWDVLDAAGVPLGPAPSLVPTSPPPTRREEAQWMATKGTLWFLRRSVDLIPYMLYMAARESLVGPREWLPSPDTPLLAAAEEPEPVPE